MFKITAQHKIQKNETKTFTFFDTCGSENVENAGIENDTFIINISEMRGKIEIWNLRMSVIVWPKEAFKNTIRKVVICAISHYLKQKDPTNSIMKDSSMFYNPIHQDKIKWWFKNINKQD